MVVTWQDARVTSFWTKDDTGKEQCRSIEYARIFLVDLGETHPVRVEPLLHLLQDFVRVLNGSIHVSFKANGHTCTSTHCRPQAFQCDTRYV
jgi:hypothetical protein